MKYKVKNKTIHIKGKKCIKHVMQSLIIMVGITFVVYV